MRFCALLLLSLTALLADDRPPVVLSHLANDLRHAIETGKLSPEQRQSYETLAARLEAAPTDAAEVRRVIAGVQQAVADAGLTSANREILARDLEEFRSAQSAHPRLREVLRQEGIETDPEPVVPPPSKPAPGDPRDHRSLGGWRRVSPESLKNTGGCLEAPAR